MGVEYRQQHRGADDQTHCCRAYPSTYSTDFIGTTAHAENCCLALMHVLLPYWTSQHDIYFEGLKNFV